MRDKQGVDNSYKSPDAVNAIDWRRKTMNGDVFMYYKRLIDLRKSHPAFRMGEMCIRDRHIAGVVHAVDCTGSFQFRFERIGRAVVVVVSTLYGERKPFHYLE